MKEKEKVALSQVVRAIHCLLECPDARRVTVYQSPGVVIKASRRFRRRKGSLRDEVVLTLGRPNWSEKQFIKDCLKAGEKFPVGRPQIKWWEKKKG